MISPRLLYWCPLAEHVLGTEPAGRPFGGEVEAVAIAEEIISETGVSSDVTPMLCVPLRTGTGPLVLSTDGIVIEAPTDLLVDVVTVLPSALFSATKLLLLTSHSRRLICQPSSHSLHSIGSSASVLAHQCRGSRNLVGDKDGVSLAVDDS